MSVPVPTFWTTKVSSVGLAPPSTAVNVRPRGVTNSAGKVAPAVLSTVNWNRPTPPRKLPNADCRSREYLEQPLLFAVVQRLGRRRGAPGASQQPGRVRGDQTRVVQVGAETPDRCPHRVQRHRLLRAAAAAVLGGAVGAPRMTLRSPHSLLKNPRRPTQKHTPRSIAIFTFIAKQC